MGGGDAFDDACSSRVDGVFNQLRRPVPEALAPKIVKLRRRRAAAGPAAGKRGRWGRGISSFSPDPPSAV